MRLANNVTLSLTDSQGEAAVITITDVVSNKATAGWKCERWGSGHGGRLSSQQEACVPLPLLSTAWAGGGLTNPAARMVYAPAATRHPCHPCLHNAAGRCRPTRRDNCTCVPEVALLGGGRFRVMPQWRRATLPGRLADTTLQVPAGATAGGAGQGGIEWCVQLGRQGAGMLLVTARTARQAMQPGRLCTPTQPLCAPPGVVHRHHVGRLLLGHRCAVQRVGRRAAPPAARLQALQQHWGHPAGAYVQLGGAHARCATTPVRSRAPLCVVMHPNTRVLGKLIKPPGQAQPLAPLGAGALLPPPPRPQLCCPRQLCAPPGIPWASSGAARHTCHHAPTSSLRPRRPCPARSTRLPTHLVDTTARHLPPPRTATQPAHPTTRGMRLRPNLPPPAWRGRTTGLPLPTTSCTSC